MIDVTQYDDGLGTLEPYKPYEEFVMYVAKKI